MSFNAPGQLSLDQSDGRTKAEAACSTSGRDVNTRQIDSKPILDKPAATEERLVREHLPLVQYLASEVGRRVPHHVRRDDLVSAGMLGLLQAARTYDARRGVAFDRHASARIRGALLDELRSQDWATRSVRTKARGLRSTQDELANRLGRAPTSHELATALDIAPETVQKLVDDVTRATVLNYDSIVLQTGREALISDADGPEDTLLDRERLAYLRDAIQALPGRLRQVVIGSFFEERTMRDLADEFGISESRVSQLRTEALLLVRDGIQSQLDPESLPTERRPDGRVAERKASYFAAVATASDYQTRLTAPPSEIEDVSEHVS